MKRRDFVRYSGAALAGLYGGVSTPAGALERAASGRSARQEREPDLVLALRAKRRKVAILPGGRTTVWSYTGQVRSGDPDALMKIPGSYLGPILRLRRGQRVRIDFTNRLPEQTIVHWHGLHLPEEMDGHPLYAVGTGGTYRYEFDVDNRAGTYWYHAHPHGRTAKQVYYGLAGLLLVTDEEEDALGLPSGDRDLPIVIQDRMFDSSNQFLYGAFGFGPGGGQFGGMLGSQILVNGALAPTLELPAEPHRLRLLNGSNSRVYKLGWSDGSRIRVIGTDGGLLSRAVRRDFVTLAPGQRRDLWVDFGGREVGSTLTLRSLEFDGSMFGLGPQFPVEGMPQGAEFDVLTVRIVAPGASAAPLPAALSQIERLRPAQAVNVAAPREFEFSGSFGTWTINGRTFEMTGVATDEIVTLGDTEVWDLTNPSSFGPGGMMMMRMPHPIHIHGAQFQVVERTVESGFQSLWSSLAEGLVDDGWQDTVLIMPGERVRVIHRFEKYPGTFLYHCHNLEHEDMGMMRNYRVIGA